MELITQARGQRRQAGVPVLALALLEKWKREAVAGDMILRNAVPAAVFDGDAGFVADGFEADVDFGCVLRPEGGLTPANDQPFARRPDADVADLEYLAVGQRSIRRPPRRWRRAPRTPSRPGCAA